MRFVLALALVLSFGPATMVSALEVGFGEKDITPDLNAGKPVWIAGYGQNRKAESVHDPLYVRATVFRDGDQKIAMACADVVGFDLEFTKSIRQELPDYKYVMVSASHNHEGPDTMGIWGPGITKSGIDPEYMALLKANTVAAIKEAEATAQPVKAFYGTADDETLLRDSREPYIFDPTIRVLKFAGEKDGKLTGILVQWNCHPETMGGDNKSITADFIGTTVDVLKKKYGVPVSYFTGPVGGLMAPPRDTLKSETGEGMREGDFAFCKRYGEVVADLAAKAIDRAEPIQLDGFVVSTKPIAVPLENPMFKAARMLGVLKRKGLVWKGDPEVLGEDLSPKNARTAEGAAETEVAYVKLGELHIACIPGEIYPENVYAKVQDPVDPGADYPDAPPEPAIVETLPGKKILIIGLANDEIGYIVPKRQWDRVKPFAYGRQKDQYGEENSMGSEAAPVLYEALKRRVAEAGK